MQLNNTYQSSLKSHSATVTYKEKPEDDKIVRYKPRQAACQIFKDYTNKHGDKIKEKAGIMKIKTECNDLHCKAHYTLSAAQTCHLLKTCGTL